jgi:DNA helicase-2/ATP-dependent DNA helicase PcrA
MEKKLTREQQRAIGTLAKNMLILAGPGSGKTEVIVRRIVHLVTVLGINPQLIVAITFTNEAANELRQRLYKYDIGDFGYIGTLHGYCLRILQQYGGAIGYGPRITVLNQDQADELLKSCAAMLNYKGSYKRIKELRDAVDGPTSHGGRPEDIVVGTYYRLLKQSDSVDYRMMLTEALRLLITGDHSLKIRALLVDEFQDSARPDFGIYAYLPAEWRFYVGDPDQAVYGFRGGCIDNILEIEQDKEFHVIRLEQNWRSVPGICDAAQRLIEHNRNRVAKKTISMQQGERGGGFLNVLPQYPTGEAEELQIMVAVHECLARPFGTVPADIAVLARNNDAVDNMIKHAEALGIPVNKRAPMPLDWKLACATVDMLVNPFNDLVFGFWLNEYGRASGAGDDQRRLLIQSLRDKAATVGEPLCKVWAKPPPRDTRPDELPAALANIGISPESIALIQARAGDLIRPTLTEIALAITRDAEPRLTRGDGVTITTFHGSKGREWEYLYIVGADQAIIPGTRKDVDVESERRLFYVAMTRARKSLVISSARVRRQQFGPPKESEPSQFIAESIPPTQQPAMVTYDTAI